MNIEPTATASALLRRPRSPSAVHTARLVINVGTEITSVEAATRLAPFLGKAPMMRKAESERSSDTIVMGTNIQVRTRYRRRALPTP